MMSAMLAMPGHSDDGELDAGLLSRCQAGEQAALRVFVERYQRVRRPAGERPTDWATKIHIALAPVYYQNYLLGELAASQIERAIVASTGRPLVGNKDAAAFLRERYFKPGASMRWDALVEKATGAPLSPSTFAEEFVTAGG